MIRLLFRALPVAVLVLGIYHGADKAKTLFATSKDAVLQVQARATMSGLARQLQPLVLSGEPLPRSLPAYLKEATEGGGGGHSGLDPWDTPYELRPSKAGVFLASCGPDKQCKTKDDLTTLVAETATASLAAPGKRATASARAKGKPARVVPGPADPGGTKEAELRKPSTAPIYRWVDQKGVVHFGQDHPASGPYEVVQGGK